MRNPFLTFLASARDFVTGDVPTRRGPVMSPRNEPSNISASATASTLQAAIRSAEYGNTQELFRFYRDALMNDDLVQGELGKRKLAVIGQPTAVLPADKSNPDDVAAAAACLRAICDCENWNGGLGALLSSSLWPVALAENIFRTADPDPVTFTVKSRTTPDGALGDRALPSTITLRFTLKRIEPVNPMMFCFQHAYFGSGSSSLVGKETNPYQIDPDEWEPYLRLWPLDNGQIVRDASRATKLDPTRHLVHRGHLITDQRDNWGGPFRAILAWWLLRGLGRDWFGRFMERYGMPFPVGKTNVTDPEAISFLQNAFSLATKIGGLVIGQDDAVELKEAAVQGGAEGHNTWRRVCDDAISKLIVGYGNSDKPAGLNAGEDNLQASVRQDIRIFDQRLLAETLEKQLFARFLKINGLTGRVRVAWGGLSTGDAKQFAELLKTTKEAGFEPTDSAIPTVEDKLGIEVQRAAPPPQLGGFGAEAPPQGRAASPRAPSDLSLNSVTLLSTHATMADALGVPATWLNPLRAKFAEMEAKAADKSISDEDLLKFLQEASDTIPELFAKMDIEALTKTMEAGMGKAVMDGVRQRLRQRPEIAP